MKVFTRAKVLALTIFSHAGHAQELASILQRLQVRLDDLEEGFQKLSSSMLTNIEEDLIKLNHRMNSVEDRC